MKKAIRDTEALIGKVEVEKVVTEMAWQLFDRKLCLSLYKSCGYKELL